MQNWERGFQTIGCLALLCAAPVLSAAGKVPSIQKLHAANHSAVKSEDPLTLRESPEIFPLREIRKGQIAVGYTVYDSSVGLEAFAVEIIGVAPDFLGPSEPLIIVHLLGEKIQRTGVISGMSGSPVYIDGRLVGAVGYRLGSFTKDAVAGVTPIERMMTSAPAPSTNYFAQTESANISQPVPINTPVFMSGLHPKVAEAFQEGFEKRHMVVASGSGGRGTSYATNRLPVDRLVPGGPIATRLISGDFHASGVGTVTWVGGDRFLAYGHPSSETGSSKTPVATAEIVTTVASDAGSWKLGHMVQPVGMFTDDRLHAVAGTTKSLGETIPLDVSLSAFGPRADADALKNAHFEIAKSTRDAGFLASIAVAQMLFARIGIEPGGTVEADYRIEVEGFEKPMTWTTRASTPYSTDGYIVVAFGLLQKLEPLLNNPYHPIAVRSIQIDVRATPDIHKYRIESVEVLAPPTAGKKLPVRVTLLSFRGKRIRRRIQVWVPATFSGEAELHVMSARAANSEWDTQYSDQLPATFGEWLSLWDREHAPGGIYVSWKVQDDAIFVGAHRTNLGLSRRELLSAQPERAAKSRLIPAGQIDLPGVVTGRSSQKIIVASPTNTTQH